MVSMRQKTRNLDPRKKYIAEFHHCMKRARRAYKKRQWTRCGYLLAKAKEIPRLSKVKNYTYDVYCIVVEIKELKEFVETCFEWICKQELNSG